MSPSQDTLFDPISNQTISQLNPHFNVLRLYYNILPSYEKEFTDALELYNKTFHQYAIQLLQTAEWLNITVRPPGFRPSPLPPTAHKLVLNKDYTFSLLQVPVSQQPPDPDPAKQAIRVNPSDPNDFIIVPIGLQPGPIKPVDPTIPLTDDMVVTYLKQIAQTDPNRVLTIMNLAMSK